MNKRSAMIISAGLIVALVAGAYALALGVTGPAVSASAKTVHPKTSTKTVMIHKKAPSSDGAGAMSAPLNSSGSSYSSSSSAGMSSGAGSTYVAPTGGEPSDGGGQDD